MKIKQIILDNFPEEYAKTDLVLLTKRKKEALPFFQWRMAIWVPISLSVMQLLIAIFMVYLVMTNKSA